MSSSGSIPLLSTAPPVVSGWRVIAVVFLGLSGSVHAVAEETLTIAVASNFTTAMQALVARFTTQYDQPVRISAASTGKLYAQITNGAPYDALFAADAERPRLLEASGHGLPGTRFTYAVGKLVLWSRDPALAGTDCRAALDRLGRHRLAIANPGIAPYGRAARETLERLGLWDQVRPRLVIGENIAQALQFAASGNARLGFVAAAQIRDPRLPETACAWTVPAQLHAPIEQQALLLAKARDKSSAREFLAFVQAADGRRIILQHGYTVPR